MRGLLAILFVGMWMLSLADDKGAVAEGDNAIDFKLKTVDGNKIKLSELNESGAVVLVVLRGWPEYQCPLCSRQVGEFVAETESFKKLGAKVMMVYPGPSAQLSEKANEFADDFDFPDNILFTLDPNYSMVNKYGLRWDAPKETAYPSTFVIDDEGVIRFSKISKTHGGRAGVGEVLNVLKSL